MDDNNPSTLNQSLDRRREEKAAEQLMNDSVNRAHRTLPSTDWRSGRNI
jgi:hypothetical protein